MDTTLIVVDFQVDFVSGSLAVPGAMDALPNVVELMEAHHARDLPVILTRDWHPADHFSFDENPRFVDGSWPSHCVQNSPGAAILKDVYEGAVPYKGKAPLLVSKGTHQSQEAYSAFEGTLSDGQYLADYLHGEGVKNLVVVGLAFDYCVKWTALDGAYDFNVWVARDATAAVSEDTAEEAVAELEEGYVEIVSTADVIAGINA